MSTRPLPPSALLIGLLVAGLVASSPAPADAQRLPVPVTGREARITLDDGTQLRGELIEATRAGVAVGASGALERAALARVASVRVRQHDFTGTDALLWVGIGALVSGAGMALACSSVADASCASVFPSVALSFGVIGGLFTLGMTSSAWRQVPVSAEELRAYARFPQGAPAGFAPLP